MLDLGSDQGLTPGRLLWDRDGKAVGHQGSSSSRVGCQNGNTHLTRVKDDQSKLFRIVADEDHDQ